jgi:microcystin degradation protein MlrC
VSGKIRIYYGGLSNETNAFSPIPCAQDDFMAMGSDWTRDPNGPFAPALSRDCEVLAGSNLMAPPAGLVTDAAYEALTAALLAEIAAQLPLTGVLLNLHGAMATRLVPDCEGDILERVRRLVGPQTFVGATLDPHCHLSQQMIAHADALICYKEYPHTDIAATTRRLVAICLDHAANGQPLRHAVFDCRQIDLYYTTHPQMRQIIDEMHKLEALSDPPLSISIAHGFPWGDDESLGTKVLVYTSGPQTIADTIATHIGRRLMAIRGECGPKPVSVARALEVASSEPGLTVAADIADNPGGGAPGDSTFILQELLASEIGPVALGPIWDPVAVEFACKAGVGAQLSMRIGGKAGSTSGSPVDVEAEVIGVVRNYTEQAPGYGDLRASYGDIVGIRVKQTAIVLCSLRMQGFSPALFAAVGIQPSEQRLIVVKSTQHFHAGFASVAARILYVDATGALSFDFGSLPRRKTPRDLWPLKERCA